MAEADVFVHHGAMDASELDRLVDDAVSAWRAAQSPEAADRAWPLVEAAANAGPPAAEKALGIIGAEDPAVRGTACNILRLVCERFESPRGAAAAALVSLAVGETDDDVQVALAYALGATNDPRGVDVLAALSHHADEDVRYAAACSLPAAMVNEVQELGVRALIALSADDSPEVRNWATFGLGRQLEADSPEIRTTLWARVDDESLDVREEAIAGLARRRERRSLPYVAECLESGEVASWIFEAADYLGDPSLVAILETYGADEPAVARALASCDPIRREQHERQVVDLAHQTQELLDARLPGAAVATWCGRLEVGSTMGITFDGCELLVSPDAALNAGGADTSASAQRLVDRLVSDFANATDSRDRNDSVPESTP